MSDIKIINFFNIKYLAKDMIVFKSRAFPKVKVNRHLW